MQKTAPKYLGVENLDLLNAEKIFCTVCVCFKESHFIFVTE